MTRPASPTREEVLVAFEVFGRLLLELRTPAAAGGEDSDLLNITETAKYLRCSHGFVRSAIRRGELQASRLAPKVFRVKRSVADAFRRDRETAR